MNEKRIDLNLLRVFHAIMTEHSVTLAAHRLDMTQPAVSNALARLRDLFKDQLFVKASSGVQPTKKAMEIWPEINESLERIRRLVLPPEFDPRSSRMKFSIAIADALLRSLVPALASRFNTEAPSARLQFHPHDNTRTIAELQHGDVDCAIGMFPSPPESLHVAALFADEYVWVMRRGNRLARTKPTLKSFVAAKHVLTKPSGSERGVVDEWLGVYGLKRDIVFVVNRFSDALSIVRQTDLVTAMPLRFLTNGGKVSSTLKVTALPFDTEKILYKMLWHERVDPSSAQRWFRAFVADIVKKQFLPAPPHARKE